VGLRITGPRPARGDYMVRPAFTRTIGSGGCLSGVALLDAAGDTIAVAGELERYEVRALAALVTKRGPPDLVDKLFDGEIVTGSFENKVVYLAIAEGRIFVLAVSGSMSSDSELAVACVRDRIAIAIRLILEPSSDDWVPPSDGGAGSGSPPAEAFVFLPHRRRGGGDPN
jgi:hypothetical protein